jgi:hypothetical protein
MSRAYYDLTVDESSMGECSPAERERYCELAAEVLGVRLSSEDGRLVDVRVRLGDIPGYTAIGPDGYTWQGPLTELMQDVLGEVYQDGAWCQESAETREAGLRAVGLLR